MSSSGSSSDPCLTGSKVACSDRLDNTKTKAMENEGDSGSIMRELSDDSGKGETSSSGTSSEPSLSGSKDSGIAQTDKQKATQNEEVKAAAKVSYNY